MSGEIEPQLVGLLQASIAFMDALRDLGLEDGVRVELDREAGLRVLELVAGARHGSAEAWSQSGKPGEPGVNSLRVAGVTYRWPAPELAEHAMPVLRSHALASPLQASANDNFRRVAVAQRGYSFED